MIAVQIETVNNKGDVEVLHRYTFKHPSQAHHLAAWWIKKYINHGFNIIPIGLAMHCVLIHPKNNANVHIFIEEI